MRMGPWDEISALIRRGRETKAPSLSLSFPTRKRLYTKKWVPTIHQICWCLHLRPQNNEK